MVTVNAMVLAMVMPMAKMLATVRVMVMAMATPMAMAMVVVMVMDMAMAPIWCCFVIPMEQNMYLIVQTVTILTQNFSLWKTTLIVIVLSMKKMKMLMEMVY